MNQKIIEKKWDEYVETTNINTIGLSFDEYEAIKTTFFAGAAICFEQIIENVNEITHLESIRNEIFLHAMNINSN